MSEPLTVADAKILDSLPLAGNNEDFMRLVDFTLAGKGLKRPAILCETDPVKRQAILDEIAKESDAD